jgi:hypothetical protein
MLSRNTIIIIVAVLVVIAAFLVLRDTGERTTGTTSQPSQSAIDQNQ